MERIAALLAAALFLCCYRVCGNLQFGKAKNIPVICAGRVKMVFTFPLSPFPESCSSQGSYVLIGDKVQCSGSGSCSGSNGTANGKSAAGKLNFLARP